MYDFLMEYERLDFAEALRILAKRTGVELSQRSFDAGLSSKKEQLYQINALAKEYYHYVLTKHDAGKQALTYVKARGITDKVIDTFALGFAPSTGAALCQYLVKKKNYQKDLLIEAGLAIERGGRLIDFFRGRLMFPLIDHRDNVVGFSGRLLDKNATTYKYINTGETPVYHKSEHVFGINITKDAIRKENQVILVEGEFDLLSCFQNGIGNVVAVKGTALTEQQVNLLGRYAQKITFCFDGDKAGQEAIRRSLVVVEKKGLIMTVVIPTGKDPDEALKTQPGIFKKAIKDDTGMYDYLFEKTLHETDAAVVEGKKRISEQLLPVIAHIENEIVKEHYLRKLAQELGTSYESIAKELVRMTQKANATKVSIPEKTKKRSREETLEEYLIALLIQSENPKTSLTKAATLLHEILAQERAYQKIFAYLLTYFERTEDFDSKQFAVGLPSELLPLYDTCLLFPLPGFEDQEKFSAEVEKVSLQLKRLYLQKKIKDIALQMKLLEGNGEEEKLSEVKRSYTLLLSQLESV